MKFFLHRWLLLGVVSAVPLVGRAQNEEWLKKVYVQVDGGAAWTSSTEVSSIFGMPSPGSTASFDVGPRFGADFGYQFTDWVAGEFDLGFMANSIKSISGTWASDATLTSVPMMFNVKFRLPNRSLVTPYAGMGVGGSSSFLDVDQIGYQNIWFSGSGSDFVFAWQAFAGFRVALNENMGLGVEYRYFHSDGPSFEADYGYYYDSWSNAMQFGDIETQSVSLRFDVRF